MNCNSMLKKSQSSIEFIILTGIIMLFFSVFFLSIQESGSDKLREKRAFLAKQTAFIVQDEINLALKSGDGYERRFVLPESLDGMDYNAIVIDEMIYIKTADNKSAVALPIPKITGNLVKGENTIRKENSEIKLN